MDGAVVLAPIVIPGAMDGATDDADARLGARTDHAKERAARCCASRAPSVRPCGTAAKTVVSVESACTAVTGRKKRGEGKGKRTITPRVFPWTHAEQPSYAMKMRRRRTFMPTSARRFQARIERAAVGPCVSSALKFR